ncbi:zinc finger CCCH domain-containing protein 25-like isoform X1 [Camellia sinensis]|uniref:zinc finger CCCH domain-containing protein 25-like isoform X1 n=1 Tax=Camellia sinensis TaxID=4442 RepID=UPI0010366839|nr:zinc finger CCCH domain-containing protein 25-like isoform X1 [Camellia sinensis]XP_028127421.1 zinc finger CCCH domain-containing protein 25-like isoform X1 [Camellia sinensis]XP_028127427.1 zinc finger CCCH domain-containing protein 25-like isoform X1 [Camellia sinensis]XP_028127432.1 zinc finger CCCH domain-containing protein 25-like isoform X1 [Camellia sinensis]XP_028127437.1 zinc finger CCCH domain-containing protein 25-like isoform X1 [Camellia sinensis]XP_028127447.1 zinc finger CCC
MNPLTLVKRIQNINSKEAALGISEQASWHAKYKDSAYVFVGGIPFDLTEGDLLAVFAQYGEIVDVNLVRDKGTGKSKGFAFIAYEDQRSTNLAVDNLNGAQVLGRIIRVDHVTNYKKKEEEDEETERQKREARGVCRAFQRGECNRGAGCKFSHDEQVLTETFVSPPPCTQRAANTGWGPEDYKKSRWGHDRFEGSTKSEKQTGSSNRNSEFPAQEGHRSSDRGARSSRTKGSEVGRESQNKLRELKSRDTDHGDMENQFEQKEKMDQKEDWDKRGGAEKRPRRHDAEPNSREDHDNDRREEKRSRRNESESYHKEDLHTRGRDRRSDHDRDSSSHRHSRIDEDYRHRSRR